MAKKDKDKKKEEELNEENQGEINESDDNFGLPDIDYKPLDEEEADDGELEDDAVEETVEEEVSEEEIVVSEEEIDEGDDASSDDVPPATPERKFAYEESSNPAGKIILAVIAIVVVIGAVWFFGFYRPKQVEKEKAAQEQAEKDRLAREEAARLERERQAALAAEEAAAEEEAEMEQPTDTGEIATISERTGRYYVIVGSFIDGDLAMDYGKELAEKGTSSTVLAPIGEIKFYRLAIGDFDTWSNAQSQADQVKGEYGENTWVVKY